MSPKRSCLQTSTTAAREYELTPKKEIKLRSRTLSLFWTGNLLRGVPEVDECGLAEIGNSKEETRGTQFRQVRVARCVIPYVLYAV
jgi:hypothetical protein